MGPMGNISLAEEMGRPSQKMIDYFSERAAGGVGLITSGLIPVSQKVEQAFHTAGFALLMLLMVVVTYHDLARLDVFAKIQGLF